MEVIMPQVVSTVPAFLTKLWKMVDDPETSHLIEWSDTGNSFVIHHQGEFAASLLPYYYKHSNMASFVRQLNMYGFHKVVAPDSGGLKSERVESMEFAHRSFLRGHEHLLEDIKRKASGKALSVGGLAAAASGAVGAGFVHVVQADRVNEVMNEVTQLKDKQEDVDGKLETMKTENEALWRQVVSLRQKHMSQQRIVNKLIHFLVSLVQPRMAGPAGAAVKRHYQPKLAIEGGSKGGGSTTTTFTLGPDNTITSGPVIHEVTNDGAAAVAAAAAVGGGSGSGSTQPSRVEMPATPEAETLIAVDPNLLTPTLTLKTPLDVDSSSTAAAAGEKEQQRPAFHRETSQEEIDHEVKTVQRGLDDLKDLLSGQITMVSSLVSNLFSPEDPLPPGFPGGGSFAGSASGMDLLYNLMEDHDPLDGGWKLPIDMETTTAAGAVDGCGTLPLHSPSTAEQDATADCPSLFELTDIEDGSSSGGPSPPKRSCPTVKVAHSAGSNGRSVAKDEDFSLNTPVICGDSQDSPLTKSIRRKRK